MLNQDAPFVQAAVAQEARMVRLEEGQRSILGHVESIDNHLATQNGRLSKGEAALAQTTAALTSHLNQVNDRQEFDRLVLLERRVGSIEQQDQAATARADGADVATKRFTAAMAAGVALFMGFANAVTPLVSKLLGL